MGQFLQFCCPRAGDRHIVENCSTALSHIMLLLTEYNIPMHMCRQTRCTLCVVLLNGRTASAQASHQDCIMSPIDRCSSRSESALRLPGFTRRTECTCDRDDECAAYLCAATGTGAAGAAA